MTPTLSSEDFQLLERLDRMNVAGEPRPVIEKSGWQQALGLSDRGLIAIESVGPGGRLHVTRKGSQAVKAFKLGTASDPVAEAVSPVVSMQTMRLADGRADHFVSIRVGGRQVHPHVFRDEYKSAYHVALYEWLLNGGDEPDLMAFDDGDFPAQKTELVGADPVRLAELETRLAKMVDELHEARQTPWPEWAAFILKTLRDHGYDPDDGSGEIDLGEAFSGYIDGVSSEDELHKKRVEEYTAEIALLKALVRFSGDRDARAGIETPELAGLLALAPPGPWRVTAQGGDPEGSFRGVVGPAQTNSLGKQYKVYVAQYCLPHHADLVALLPELAAEVLTSRTSLVTANEAGRSASFKSLCYGAKFRYTPESERVWVKIGHDLIAEWDAGKVSDDWIGQSICSFSEDGDLTKPVFLVVDA